MINAFKQKLSLDKSKPKTIIISTLNRSRDERLPIIIPKIKVLTFATKEVDIAIIGTDAYCITCKLKKAQVFAISIKYLEY